MSERIKITSEEFKNNFMEEVTFKLDPKGWIEFGSASQAQGRCEKIDVRKLKACIGILNSFTSVDEMYKCIQCM